jgi:hypothetical protein
MSLQRGVTCEPDFGGRSSAKRVAEIDLVPSSRLLDARGNLGSCGCRARHWPAYSHTRGAASAGASAFKSGLGSNPFQHPRDPRRRHRRAALVDKQMAAPWPIAAQLAQGPQLDAGQRVHGLLAALGALDDKIVLPRPQSSIRGDDPDVPSDGRGAAQRDGAE